MKTGKKALAVLLAVVMLFTALPLRSAAQEQTSTPTLTVESTSTRTGSTVDVQITIQNNPGILGATLALRYDDKLTLTAATAGDAFSPLSLTKPGQFASPCQFIWDGEDLADEDIKDGCILTLTFQVADNVASGSELPVRISYVPGDLIDKNLKSVSADIVNGTITVIDFTPGDVNDDGYLNTTDIICLRRYLSGGYGQTIHTSAADVNDDGKLNTLDIILIRRYLAGGYGVALLASHGVCTHSLEAFAAVPASCTENGNIAYWHCTICGRYFSDEDGGNEIQLADAVIKPFGHTPVVDPAVAPTYTSTGLTEGSHCSLCGLVIVQQEVVAALQPREHMISYDVANGDPYLLTLLSNGEIENTNPNRYSEDSGLTLHSITVDGYRFLGWYDGAGANATEIKKITAGSTEDVELFAHWEKIVYQVQYKSSIYLEENQATYTVDAGLVLPTPKLSNYVFTGWADEDGKLYENKMIPVGTTGNITLTANWTSERNKTWTKTELDDPIIEIDEDNNTLLFAYEIGLIENVPLYTIKDFGFINEGGIERSESTTYATTITQATTESIANTIARATVESADWTLSKEWNEKTSYNSSKLEESGMDRDKAITLSKSSSSNWNVSSGSSGSRSSSHVATNSTGMVCEANIYGENSTDTSGQTTQHNYTNAHLGASSSIGAKIADIGAEIKAEASDDWGNNQTSVAGTNTHEASGFDVYGRNEETSFTADTNSSTSSWNNSSSYGGSTTSGQSETTAERISHRIVDTYGYGEEQNVGGGESSRQGISSSQSSSDEYTSTVSYITGAQESVTSSWNTRQTKAGYHRWVVAGTAHVFAVVGYNMSTKAYFVYTYSVMDDETHEFEDYSYTTAQYNDEENGVISFEIPYEVAEYVAEFTCYTDGLKVDQTTGLITGYTGTDTCVVIPEYMNVGGGKVIKITGISSNAFRGNSEIGFVHLSDYTTEIPDNAFNGCISLIGVTGGEIKRIGNKAFYGCTNLETCVVKSTITSLGTNAFYGAARLLVNVTSAAMLEAAVNSGAKSIEVFFEKMPNAAETLRDVSITVPERTDYFSINGKCGNENLSFTNFTIKSQAGETVINNASFVSTTGIPLQIASPEVSFDAVTVNATGIAMVLLAEDTNVGLQGTITVQSDNTNALLCKNISLYETNPQVDGRLVVIRKILVCGNDVSQNQYLTYNEYETIDEDTFNNLLNSYTLYFDANDGSCSETSRKVPNCTPIGELPTPTRPYYTFVGWYLSDGTTPVTKDTVFTTGLDQTLYAHWDENPLVGWVKASEVPDGAEVVNRKWSYTQTSYTTSSSPTLTGWTQYDSTSAWSDWGGWSSWSTTPAYNSDSRQAQSEDRHTGYNMVVYNTMTTGGKRQFRSFSVNGSYSAYGLSSSYGEYSYSMWASVDTVQNATTVAEGSYTSACSYPGTNKGYGTGYVLDYGGSWYVFFVSSNTYSTYYRYRDRSLVYTYYFSKTEEKESASQPEGENISDIQEWVMYRAQ